VKDRDEDGVPTGFLPTAMANYVATNFPGVNIIEVNKERSKFEVELNNGVELVFDKNGNFLRYDN
jgi:Protein of unknown function (DUF2874).